MVSKRSNPSRKPLIVTLTLMVLVLSIFWFRALRAPKLKPPKPPVPADKIDTAPRPDESMLLSPSLRAVPGVAPVRILRYRNPAARQVAISGSWDDWSKQHPMKLEGGIWRIDVDGFGLKRGRYGFKFLSENVETLGHLRKMIELNTGDAETTRSELSSWLKD